MGLTYSFTAELWLYPGHGSWHFMTLPTDCADEIHQISEIKRGFGSIKVTAIIGKSSWDTSIFPDTKSKSYLLPVKKQIRQAAGLSAGDKVRVTIRVINK